MNQAVLQVIRDQIEIIEDYPGYGQVVVKIENGEVKIIEPTARILVKKDCQFDK